MEGPGLWNFIKQEFTNSNKTFNKPAVKICVYSSFFLGGNKGMITGILESYRKDIGYYSKEFRDSEFYEQAYKIAQQVTEQMQNYSIIDDFRDISKYIKESYINSYLIGPTGHSYMVTDNTFTSVYPNYLQSFEFALLSEGFLRTKIQYPESRIIGHFHDGNVLALSIDSYEKIIETYSQNIKNLGSELHLHYPQTLEIKRVYM